MYYNQKKSVQSTQIINRSKSKQAADQSQNKPSTTTTLSSLIINQAWFSKQHDILKQHNSEAKCKACFTKFQCLQMNEIIKANISKVIQDYLYNNVAFILLSIGETISEEKGLKSHQEVDNAHYCSLACMCHVLCLQNSAEHFVTDKPCKSLSLLMSFMKSYSERKRQRKGEGGRRRKGWGWGQAELCCFSKLQDLYEISFFFFHTCVCSVILCDPMECSLPASSVCGNFQAKILEWIVISSTRGSFQPRDRT